MYQWCTVAPLGFFYMKRMFPFLDGFSCAVEQAGCPYAARTCMHKAQYADVGARTVRNISAAEIIIKSKTQLA